MSDEKKDAAEWRCAEHLEKLLEDCGVEVAWNEIVGYSWVTRGQSFDTKAEAIADAAATFLTGSRTLGKINIELKAGRE